MTKRRGKKATPATATGSHQGPLVVGALSLNLAERCLTRGRKRIHMTPKMCALLQVFMANRGKLLTRQFLMEKVWETSYMGDTRTLDVHIHMLRRALEDDPSKPGHLRTVRGFGYVFEIPDA